MLIINIVVAAIMVTVVVSYLVLRRQKKVVMDEVNQLSLRLAEMEMKVASPPHMNDQVETDEDKANSLGSDTSDLSAMNDEELFCYLSKAIKDEEMFRRPELNRKAVKERFSLSAARIGNAFVRGGGMGLPEFVRNCRLDHACRLMLEQPNMPFTEVGNQSGYQHTTTFYHDFKARFGMPPAEYREKELKKRVT